MKLYISIDCLFQSGLPLHVKEGCDLGGKCHILYFTDITPWSGGPLLINLEPAPPFLLHINYYSENCV